MMNVMCVLHLNLHVPCLTQVPKLPFIPVCGSGEGSGSGEVLHNLLAGM